jgi:hypothetical protein
MPSNTAYLSIKNTERGSALKSELEYERKTEPAEKQKNPVKTGKQVKRSKEDTDKQW